MKEIKKEKDYDFCEEEKLLYDEIIDLLEMDVDKEGSNILKYNSIPLIVGKRTLIRLCEKTFGFNNKEFITFKPLKNNFHCNLLLEYIHEYENESLELITKKEKRDGKTFFKARLYDPENDENVAEVTNCYSEIESKFKCLYIYFFGEDNDLNKRILKIRKFDNKYNREHKDKTKRKVRNNA